jgi:hypothetical protein
MNSEMLRTQHFFGIALLIYVTEVPLVGSRGLSDDFRDIDEFTGTVGIAMS